MLSNGVELFYTDSKTNEDLVDQIKIDVANKTFVMYINADINITDGEDENGEEIYSLYVSRFVFDLIVQGVKEKDFKQIELY